MTRGRANVVVSRVPLPAVPLVHADEAEHRRLLAMRVNANDQTKLPQTVFDDYITSGLTVALGADAPALKTFRGTLNLPAFLGTGVIVEQGFFEVHILHGFRVDSSPTFHVHWAHNTAAPTGNVKWLIDYSIARGYGAGTYPAPSTLTTVQAAPAQYVHEITDDDDMTIPASVEFEPDSVLLGRIYRNPADAADTFENDAFLIQVDMHYERSHIGTIERNRPFTSAGFG